MREVP